MWWAAALALAPGPVLLEQGRHVRVHPIARTDELEADPAFAVDQVAFRVLRGAPGPGHLRAFVQRDPERDFLAGEELVDRRPAVFVHAHRQHLEGARVE